MTASTTAQSLPDRDGLPEDERAEQQAWRARYAHEVKDLVVHRLVPSPKLTIIVVSYRPREYLIECLQHLRAQTARDVPYEILLADSGGLEHLRSRTASLCDIDLRLRDGILLNEARNTAMAWARGEYVAIVDDDGLVAPTFVEVVCRIFEDPKIAAMRGRIVAKEHPYFCTLAGHYDRGDEMIEDALITEGHMAIRRRVYLLSGGFPDKLFGHEGIYLAYRIEKTFPGMRVVYAPELLMRHDYMDGLGKLIRKLRKFTTSVEEVTSVDKSEEFERYLQAYLSRKMPQRPLTLDQKIARSALRTIRFAVERAPAWAFKRPS
ncbi:glycosyltransferase family 2 protein [Polyangium aurulentum]|uniref:glycosyltransferase family 2 protein n=1 Tax=Polyangium aurulentum TaxID=2567896 RepID=UPI0010AE6A3D|nr:glycosyltransferase [Polyangium aurulentum]UQA58559.1 glycosyltransferase [Polyangium aurulentum]